MEGTKFLEGHGEGPFASVDFLPKPTPQSDHGTTSNFSRGTFYKIFAQSYPKLHQEQGKPTYHSQEEPKET